jgi:putative glutamine amidotransferase
MERQIVIGITDCGSYHKYENWILKEPGIRTLKLSYKDNNLRDLVLCDGVILSGGEDVHPRLYNKPEYLRYCDEIIEARDAFELSVLEHTEKNHVPLLGICRGLQVANVFFGGSLIPDIPSFGKFNHSKFPKEDRYHDVLIDANSHLFNIAGSTSGSVNSAHHQSADLIGKGLVVNSFSPEGIVEGIERRKQEGKAYLMLVQWHPERMTDQENVLSKNIKSSFLTEAGKHLRA